MIRLLHNVKIDWLAQRRFWLIASSLLMLAGLGSAVGRQAARGGTDAFNLGVDFKGGTLITARFQQRPTEDEIRAALAAKGVNDAIVQSTNNPSEVLIRVPKHGSSDEAQTQAQVDVGQARAIEALESLGVKAG
ncbi:MAG TPA: hypothetical protein VER76_16710, partial [Pyrinomonadaceae bacterium]|nr:hypothetical protein [Pyrinomonadaceae bacterium]